MPGHSRLKPFLGGSRRAVAAAYLDGNGYSGRKRAIPVFERGKHSLLEKHLACRVDPLDIIGTQRVLLCKQAMTVRPAGGKNLFGQTGFFHSASQYQPTNERNDHLQNLRAFTRR